MSTDLSEYLAKQARLEQLEQLADKQAKELASAHHRASRYRTLYEQKQIELEAVKEELRLMSKRRGHYKAKWRQAVGDHELPTDKARKQIRRSKATAGYVSVSEECRRIAEALGLAEGTVRALWYAK